MWWQLAAVIVIEALAISYLAWKLFPPSARRRRKPDVKASDLLRKRDRGL